MSYLKAEAAFLAGVLLMLFGTACAVGISAWFFIGSYAGLVLANTAFKAGWEKR